MKLLIASPNERKIKWMKFIFQNLDLEIETLSSIGYDPICKEDGKSFETNSVVKAIEPAILYAGKGYIVVSDDGGVEFDIPIDRVALRSHRIDTSIRDKNAAILDMIDFLLEPKNTAHFKGACTVAWNGDGHYINFHTITYESESDIRIRNIDPDDLPSENATLYYDILERVYPDGTGIPLCNMDMLQLMETTGALSAYSRVDSIIRAILDNGGTQYGSKEI